MCGNIYPDGDMEIIGGDDFAFDVKFSVDDQPAEFSEGDTAEMVIHDGEHETVRPAMSIDGDVASFYLPSGYTESLLKDGARASYYQYCIRVNWSNGGRHTPVCRKALKVVRC